MWYCPNCGEKNQDDYRFCMSCGAPADADRTERIDRRARPAAARKRMVWLWVALGCVLLIVAAELLYLLLGSAGREPSPAPEATPSFLPVTPTPTPSPQPIPITAPTPSPEPTPVSVPGQTPVPVGTGEDLSLYLPAVEAAVEESKAFSQWGDTFAGGILYDTDGDGCRELILLYPGYVGDQAEAVYSVYTLRDGKAVNVVPRTGMGGLAVSPAYQACVFQRDGEHYLGFTMTNADTLSEIQRHSIYRCTDYEQVYWLDWEKESRTGKVTCSINGTSCSEEEFNKVLSGMEEKAHAGHPWRFSDATVEEQVKNLDCYGLLWLDWKTGKDQKLFYGDVMEWSELHALLAGTDTPATGGETVSTRLTDVSQLDSRDLEKLCGTMEGVIAENVRTTWNDVEHLTGSEYVGCYLLAAKDPKAQTQNLLIVVYRNDVSIVIPRENISKSLSYYYSLRFRNVTREADGTLSLGSYETPTERVNANIYRHNYYYDGYGSLEELYRRQVEPNLRNYTLSRNTPEQQEDSAAAAQTETPEQAETRDLAEISEKVLAHYRPILSGNAEEQKLFVIFDSEITERNGKYQIIIRYQGSPTTANVYVMDVSVDIATGSVSSSLKNDEPWRLW